MSLVHVFWGMLDRTRNPNSHKFKNYGERGIKVCDRWNPTKNARGQAYRNFVEDMGERPSGFSLDRIDVDSDYCPENCRWASQVEQQNNRTNNHPPETRNIVRHEGGYRVEIRRNGERIRKMFMNFDEATKFRDYHLEGGE